MYLLLVAIIEEQCRLSKSHNFKPASYIVRAFNGNKCDFFSPLHWLWSSRDGDDRSFRDVDSAAGGGANKSFVFLEIRK